MDGVRPACARWAARARGDAADDEMHDFAAELYLLENEPGAWWQQQHLRTHRPLSGWPSDLPGRCGLPERLRFAQLEARNLDVLVGYQRVARKKVCQSQDLMTADTGRPGPLGRRGSADPPDWWRGIRRRARRSSRRDAIGCCFSFLILGSDNRVTDGLHVESKFRTRTKRKPQRKVGDGYRQSSGSCRN